MLENCIFYNNSVFSPEGGAAAHITSYKVLQLQITFKQCHSNPHSVHYASTGAVFIYEVDSVEFLECSFEDNNSTALKASHSNIIFQGRVRIHRNTGVKARLYMHTTIRRSVYNILKPLTTYHSKSVRHFLTVQQPVAEGNIPAANLPYHKV